MHGLCEQNIYDNVNKIYMTKWTEGVFFSKEKISLTLRIAKFLFLQLTA